MLVMIPDSIYRIVGNFMRKVGVIQIFTTKIKKSSWWRESKKHVGLRYNKKRLSIWLDILLGGDNKLESSVWLIYKGLFSNNKVTASHISTMVLLCYLKLWDDCTYDEKHIECIYINTGRWYLLQVASVISATCTQLFVMFATKLKYKFNTVNDNFTYSILM